MPTYFLSCDWGTTNFRLRLVTRENLAVLDEVESDNGVSGLAKAWNEKGKADEAARQRFYLEILRDAVENLRSRAVASIDDLPVVISGMATSTLGLISLPYAATPVPVDGSGFKTHTLPATEDFPHTVLLISGLRDGEEDVMRGEETQTVGCLTPKMLAEDCLLIHPGTHSKHIRISSGKLAGFRTYMTGEAFKLFSTHGILRDSVEANPLNDATLLHFEEGVRAAGKGPLLHELFTVRTGDLFDKRGKREAFHFLSGLLIGTELENIREEKAKTYLCAGPSLHAAYSTAVRALGLDVQIFPPEWEEGSVIRGQAKVLAQVSL